MKGQLHDKLTAVWDETTVPESCENLQYFGHKTEIS
jgi:hypothetical protein